MTLRETACAAVSKDLRASIHDVLPALEARAIRLARSRPDAEDLVQETVIRALRFESTFERGTNVRAWMQQILQSVFISRCRRRSRERRAFERFSSDPTLTARATAAPMLMSVSGAMHAAFSSLPEKFRRVIELVDLSDCSYREAADILGVPVGTVMSRLFRARRMLAATLGEVRDLTPAESVTTRPVPKRSVTRKAAALPAAALHVDVSPAALHVSGVQSIERATEPLRAA